MVINTKVKNIAEKGQRKCQGQREYNLGKKAKEVLTEKVFSELRPEGSEEMSHAFSWGRKFLGKEL